MSTPNTKPKWKYALSLALKAYAGLCTLLVTACIAFIAWSSSNAPDRPEIDETVLMTQYGKYMASEYPKRADNFYGIASLLDLRSREFPVLTPDVLKYLGKPDLMAGNADNGSMVFNWSRPGVKVTNQWEIYVGLRRGRLASMGFSPVGVNDNSGYKPYPGETTPDK